MSTKLEVTKMDRDVQTLISGDLDKASDALKNFLAKSLNSNTFDALNQNNYRRDLWKSLQYFITNERIQHIHSDTISAVKILSRDKTELDEIISEDLLNALVEYSGLNGDTNYEDKLVFNIAIESLKAICNIVFNSHVGAAISCKNGTIEGIVRRLRTYRDPNLPTEIKYYDMRLLFLLTALCLEVRPRLKNELHGLTYIIETLDLLLKDADNDHNADFKTPTSLTNQRDKLSEMQVDLAQEILKVLFNLTLYPNEQVDEELEAHYLRLVTIIHDYLLTKINDSEKKNMLDSHCINLLTNMPSSCFKGLYCPLLENEHLDKELFYEDQNMEAVYHIVAFLRNRFMTRPKTPGLNELLSPTLTALVKSVTGDRLIRKHLRNVILPPLTDVLNRPEDGLTIRNCMCRLLTTPITQVRDLTAELLFVLCKENVNRMIKYTGYGNAAGLFATRGLLGGQNGDVSRYSSDSEDSDTEEYKQYKHAINPIMGCYESPHVSATDNMSEEQKEYEAMKLLQLMHNLTEKGVVMPCRIGADGRPEPVDHILQLQEGVQQIQMDDESD